MTKRKVSTLFAGILLATATLTSANVPSELFGTWDMMKTERAGVSYVITMTIEPERVVMTSLCSHDGKTVEVEVSAGAQISARQLRITGSDRMQKEYSPGYLRCTAAVKPVSLGYAFEDGKLVLTDPQKPRPMVLSRSKP